MVPWMVSDRGFSQDRIWRSLICRTFFRRLVSPTDRRFSGSRPLGAYLYPRFGLGPFPAWGDECVEEVPRVARRVRPSLKNGGRTQLFVRMARSMDVLA